MSDLALDMKVIEGLHLSGVTNTSDEQIRANVISAIRRQHPQVKQQPAKKERVCLVGSGPSLTDTKDELVEILRDGAKLVTLNGSYHWALEQNLMPSCQVLLDARPCNARFVEPVIPNCQYLVASTCHPDVWDRLEGRDRVWIYHPAQKSDPNLAAALDEYYFGHWQPIQGATTVASRALFALRTLGYLRFDLFGIDCCWLGDQHHAFPQPENEKDKPFRFTAAPSGHPELERSFICTGWHLKQLEDFLQIIRHAGQHFLLAVHGDGLLAWSLRVNADLAEAEISQEV